MKSKKEIKGFILETLLPYKENPELCALEDGLCRFLTKDGKTCAIGRWMKKGKWQKMEGDAWDLFEKYNEKDFFKKKARDMKFTDSEWDVIADYHDKISEEQDEAFINPSVDKLEEKFFIKLPELRI